MDKKALLTNISDTGIFWSYNPDKINDLPDDIIIEHILLYGSVADIINLFDSYILHDIKRTWQLKIIPDSRYYKHNVYLAKVFFNITEPEKYFRKFQKNNRYERIKKFASENQDSIS